MKGFLGKIYFQRDELCILESLTVKHIKFKRQGRRISPKRSKHKAEHDTKITPQTMNEEDLWWDHRRLSPSADRDAPPTPAPLQ